MSLDGVEEVTGALGLRMIEKGVGRPLLHYRAVGHEHDTVGHVTGEVHLMRQAT